jgi:hypothetical protein
MFYLTTLSIEKSIGLQRQGLQSDMTAKLIFKHTIIG